MSHSESFDTIDCQLTKLPYFKQFWLIWWTLSVCFTFNPDLYDWHFIWHLEFCIIHHFDFDIWHFFRSGSKTAVPNGANGRRPWVTIRRWRQRLRPCLDSTIQGRRVCWWADTICLVLVMGAACSRWDNKVEESFWDKETCFRQGNWFICDSIRS